MFQVIDLWLRCSNADTGKLDYFPVSGGLGEQPAKLIEAFEAIRVKHDEMRRV